ncbi:carboxylate-amine ligase [Arcobacter roscoffensis]|uniref:YbdK family carboxylate-amine ligase n=1 Tax=Arcobacter roscoffensis TaxID=2961520 RepID=A0ABY5E4D3_9BACT|nr:YbdK family carboxylate-amine ligase [Arcobacter roscoffensis]UTJ06712.1 YbdK family carboxylate-amine ligase [Arcobacter roscoffensis]
MGAELELRILNADDLNCANEYDYFKENISARFKDNITSEFLQCMLEINTPVFNNLSDLIKYFKEITLELNSLASKKNLLLQSSGSSALKQEHLELSSNKRYQELSNEHKILLDDFSICGLHVHVGFKNFDKALKAYNFSLSYMPIFLALSASSVYSNGQDTGIHSYRTKVFDRLPKASIPEYFTSYTQMKNVYNVLYKTEVIQSEKDVWWDVRIQPSFKTIEFRVCDAINDFDRLEIIIGLFRGICKLSQLKEVSFEPMQVLKQNMWKASRYSMNANFICKSQQKTIREVTNKLIDELYEHHIISDEFMDKAREIVSKNSIAQDMIEIYEKTNDLREVEKIGVIK